MKPSRFVVCLNTARALYRTAAALLALLWLGAVLPAMAYSYGEALIPPEVLYSRDLRQRVVVPGKVNVNKADLNELLSLPGMDENLALKLIRVRPLKSREDFRKMPFISPRNIQLLLQQIENKIEF